jgi:excisionase family DNA binding protein
MTRLLTTAEVAERLRCSVWNVRDLVRAGRLPSVRLKPRGRLLFDEDELRQAIRDGHRGERGGEGQLAPARAPAT